jgi:hypothetical protein
MVWYEHTNPNQTTTSAMEQREIRQVPQKRSTIKHSLIGSGRTNQRATSNVEGSQALSLSRTQARRLIRSKGNPPRIS